MSRRVRIEAAAKEELAGAFEWYEEQRPGLGDEFLTAVDEAISRLIDKSSISSPVPDAPPDSKARRVFVKRFPYSVVFLPSETEVQIVAFAHMKRRPGYWRSRTR